VLIRRVSRPGALKGNMATNRKTVAGTESKVLVVERDLKGKIFSPIRQSWLVETPEERVRQEYLCTLVNEYGFSSDQIGEERPVTERGSGKARADFLIWRSVAEKADKNKPLIVIECKSDNVQIDAATYTQGANYAQYCQARFFVTHNNRETRYWRVDHSKMMPNFDEIENIPHASATDREITDLISQLRVFKEEEFAETLQKCHNVIRNRESHDPTKAFDETAKILFVKVWVERELKTKKTRRNIFSVEFLEDQVGDDPVNDLFTKTKRYYEKDALFGPDEQISLRPETSRELVRLLERYNLSDTSEDIKGIAFERFLGRTFRGEIGQFFTPRPIVEFMIQMLSPKEGDVLCDPASGSGGFLIRFFEIVRQQILQSADEAYRTYEKSIAANKALSETKRAQLLMAKYADIQSELDQKKSGTRMWKLSNRCIYGTDKNDRMARTSKMNMIMHGDGHGGVHHWNGFLNVNGIFEQRFDLILTNPPFGSKLDKDEKILADDIEMPEDLERHYESVYGEPYRLSRRALRAAVGKPIASMFELSRSQSGSIKTEILFIERCLDLLKPGGRMGIVLPEGILNNPSVLGVRHFVEDRSKICAVVSLPAETFVKSGATVKTSLLFLQKYTDDEKTFHDDKAAEASKEALAFYQTSIDEQRAILKRKNAVSADFLEIGSKTTAAKRVSATQRVTAFNEELKGQKRAALKRLKEIDVEIAVRARRALRSKIRYPVFMYDAEKVGVIATGAADENELIPSPSLPSDVELSALEQYQLFCKNPKRFMQSRNGAAD
jgi:type I restriction enzyme M protein